MMATRAGDYVRNKENNLINAANEVERRSQKNCLKISKIKIAIVN